MRLPSALRSVPRRRLYPILGLLLALGAPLGLVVVRCATACSHLDLPWLRDQLRGDLATYVYVAVSTAIVFAFLGRLLGRSEDELQTTATTDALSGLANRRAFDEQLVRELELGARHGTSVSLLLIDVDGLKKINDQGGHAAGDAALRAVAEGLRETCRRTDLPARIGGDEFAVLAPMTTAAHALELANRIRGALASDGATVRAPTVSIGIADRESTGANDPSALYRAADRALYAAKSAGKDRAVVATRSPA